MWKRSSRDGAFARQEQYIYVVLVNNLAQQGSRTVLSSAAATSGPKFKHACNLHLTKESPAPYTRLQLQLQLELK